jgi:UDP-N-acetylglucosamine--N-acetylmuramyl-(pentapeptide) pyrophosphoryl-undecaprenol N-acetylglucosamine transferase
MRVVIAGGGTAGHVYPGLAVGRVLRARGHEVAFLGTAEGLEATLVPAAGFPFHAAPAAALRRTWSPSALKAPAVAARAVGVCRPVVATADAVLGMGGYVSVPAVLAARRERVPVVVHEQNARPGLANRALAHLAERIAVSFPEARDGFGRRVRPRVVLTGNPVREEILRVPEERDRLAKEARAELGLDEDRTTVLVVGGSQGALSVNRAAAGAIALLADRGDVQVVLLTGPAHLETIGRSLPAETTAAVDPSRPTASRRTTSSPSDPDGAARASRILARPLAYLERMELGYAVADLVVSRAGATTVAELEVCGLPAVLVPYPYATGDHQSANAEALRRAGVAMVVADSDLDAETLAAKLVGLLDDPARMASMAGRSSAAARPGAADGVADLVDEVAR